jgi:hypothetical protein
LHAEFELALLARADLEFVEIEQVETSRAYHVKIDAYLTGLEHAIGTFTSGIHPMHWGTH